MLYSMGMLVCFLKLDDAGSGENYRWSLGGSENQITIAEPFDDLNVSRTHHTNNYGN